MDRPPPDPAKLLEAWMEWERGDVPPGRVMATLKTGGLRDLLEALVAQARAAAAERGRRREPGRTRRSRRRGPRLSDGAEAPVRRGGPQLIPRPALVRAGPAPPWDRPGRKAPPIRVARGAGRRLEDRGEPVGPDAEVANVELPALAGRPAAVLCALFDEDAPGPGGPDPPVVAPALPHQPGLVSRWSPGSRRIRPGGGPAGGPRGDRARPARPSRCSPGCRRCAS